MWRLNHPSGAVTGAVRSLAVLPLENLSHDPEQEYFADGLTDELITQLAQIRALKVISRTSVMRYRDARKPTTEIAKELGVDGVVEGSVLRSGQRFRIAVHLSQASTGNILWAQSYERDLKDILSVQGEAARAIALEIQVKLTPQEQQRLAAAKPVNPEAYEAYLKGNYYLNKSTAEGCMRSLEFFQKAIDKDPSYALAYAGMAGTYDLMMWQGWLSPKDGFPRREAAVLKALELDDRAVRGELAYIRWDHDWNWPEAEREFQRAIALAPHDAVNRDSYADFLKSQGRWEEAIAQSRLARELDPVGVQTNLYLGAKYYWARRDDEAIEQYKKTLELDPNYALAHDYLADAYARKGMYEQAILEEQNYLRLSGDEEGAAALGRDFAAWGYDKAMRSLYQKNLDAFKAAAASKEAYVSPMLFVFSYIRLGEKDQAFAWLEKAYEERQPWLIFLRTDPQFDPLRSDPRFADLVRRVGIPS
jgi:TolB-like protein/Tfp pilus assembly protein PilF